MDLGEAREHLAAHWLERDAPEVAEAGRLVLAEVHNLRVKNDELRHRLFKIRVLAGGEP